MDAFSVSLANGLAEPKMSIGRTMGIAGVYALFQFAMPMIGWFLVEKVAEKFEVFRPLIPWIALILLLLIGGSMLESYRRALDGLLRGAEKFCCGREIPYLRLLSDMDVESEALRALARAGMIG